jgi:ribosomal protein S18 acetylase RimI-like enzyme
VLVVGPRMPNPSRPGPAQAGYIQWVATDPDCRRRGYARAVLEAVLAWCDERRLPRVELHATTSGEPLYRSLGFVPGQYPGLSRFRP